MRPNRTEDLLNFCFSRNQVVQILMSTNVPMDSEGVCVSVSMDSTGSGVSVDEEEKDEVEESVYDDDEEDVDEINHTQLSKEVCLYGT